MLDLGQRELVASTTSAYNDCFYCTSTHSARLGAYAEGVDLAAVIAGDDDENVGVEYGVELRRLTLAILRRDDERIATSRDEVATVLGEQAVSDTAAVAAYFDGMNRIADGTGTNLNPELTPPDAVLAKLPAATRRTATSESDEPA